MLKSNICFIALLILISCKDKTYQQQNGVNNNPVSDSIKIVNDPINNLNIKTSSFSEIDRSGFLMFPLTMGENERNGISLSYKEMPAESYWNIIFFNSNTNESHLLSEQKMLISSFDYMLAGQDSSTKTQLKDYIFYTIKTDDFNCDKLINNLDPQYLFISDKSGNNFRQLSPKGYNFLNWTLVKNSKKLILTVCNDSDKNKKFETSDEITTFEIELDKSTDAKEIFSIDFKNKMKILFDKDWKRIK